jgi:hypothetical protein
MGDQFSYVLYSARPPYLQVPRDERVVFLSMLPCLGLGDPPSACATESMRAPHSW